MIKLRETPSLKPVNPRLSMRRTIWSLHRVIANPESRPDDIRTAKRMMLRLLERRGDPMELTEGDIVGDGPSRTSIRRSASTTRATWRRSCQFSVCRNSSADFSITGRLERSGEERATKSKAMTPTATIASELHSKTGPSN